jgi:eukaryotic-like serine/threonine-protein kinase
MTQVTGAGPGLLGSSGGPTADELEDSRKRVRVAGFALGAIWLVILLLVEVAGRLMGGGLGESIARLWPVPGRYITLVGLALALALALAAGRVGSRPRLLRDLGLVVMVAACGLLALLETWGPVRSPGRLSWVCLIILLYPSIASDSPGRTLLTSLAAAATVPAAVLFASLRGVPLPEGSFRKLLLIVPPFLAAALAVVPSHVIHRLGREVRKAREMGSYRLGSLIGEGGMGEVYEATHQLLARPAAVKLIRREYLKGADSASAQTAIERFRREATAAAALSSPHTIELYDFGPTGDGSFYFAMERLDGLSFEALVQRFGPVPPERVLFLLRQACLSLAEAHGRNLVHRDIKPTNLYACRMGLEVDFVKVLDFGLVKEQAEESAGQQLLTAADALTGTPAFMAPEAALGDKDIDHRVDIYALGCVAYWMLTSQLPFYASNTIQMLYKQANERPTPPSAKAPQPIPASVDALVLQCLEKNPAERPPNALSLMERIDACAVGAPWTPDRARDWWAQHLPPSQVLPSRPAIPADRGDWIKVVKAPAP